MNNLHLHLDQCLNIEGPSALVIREFLEPAAGQGAVIFPPTFAPDEDAKDKKSQYVIDGEGAASTCLIDTVGSQANRLEPVFKREPYDALVPQITIRIGERPVSLLDLGHRAGDAVARSSALQDSLRLAFKSYSAGDGEPMAKLAPTSLVFGAWDSRETQVKIPRLLESSVRASNVDKLNRAAQYFSSLKPEDIENTLGMTTAEKAEKEALSSAGMLDSPAGITHGGIRVQGEILRTTIINLTALRAIGGATPEKALTIRRYILGLALVAAAAPVDLFLRQGCLLVQDPAKPIESTFVFRSGQRQALALDLEAIRQFAAEAAAAFGVGASQTVDFDPSLAKALMGKQAEKKQKKTK